MRTRSVSAVQTQALVIHLRPVVEMSDDQLHDFCRINRDLRIERTASGDLLIAPPAGGATGARNAEITYQLGAWARTNTHGVVFGSSTGFVLPNGEMRAPDAAWVERSRLARLTREQKEKFLPLCPDFVVELCSPTDDIADQKTKMEEYLAAGARLGWLIDPYSRRVHVYRPTPLQASSPIQPGFPATAFSQGSFWTLPRSGSRRSDPRL